MADKKLAGVMGYPIHHSLSPRLHGYWLKRYQIEGFYVPLLVDPAQLKSALDGLSALGFAGCNVTLPHKETILPLLHSLTDRAKRIGAVNTIYKIDGGWEGDCTDGEGFWASLLSHYPAAAQSGKNILLIGAGGAARAIVDTLVQNGHRNITMLNRTIERGQALLSDFGIEPVVYNSLSDNQMASFDLVINTSSLGMTGQPPLEINLEPLAKTAFVYDVVYNPFNTDLLLNAQRLGLANANGLGMLLHQAVGGFERWFGHKPEVDQDLYNFVRQGLSC